MILATELLFPNISPATTIVFYADTNGIIVASDSKVQVATVLTNGHVISSSSTEQKIFLFEGKGTLTRVAVALYGVSRTAPEVGEAAAVDFDAYKIARNILRQTPNRPNLAAAVDKIGGALSNALCTALNRRGGSNLLRQVDPDDHTILGIGLAAILNGTSELHFRFFYPTKTNGIFGVALEATDVVLTNEMQRIQPLGRFSRFSEIEGRLSDDAKYREQWRNHPTRMVIDLIRTEIKRAPQAVGPPIQVLQMNPDGTSDWRSTKE